MNKIVVFGLSLLLLQACKKEVNYSLQTDLDNDGLEISSDYIIACAAGMPDGFMGDAKHPVSMFFYPVSGASNYRYYETTSDNLNKWDYSLYTEISKSSLPVFNGYLRRFPLPNNRNRWGIVTYEVDGKLRVCDPVHIKVSFKPTVWSPESIKITENGVNPSFAWEEFPSHQNAIHFNVISDSTGNLISGTYTADTSWSFYDLSNVTLNIRDIMPTPSLNSTTQYKFTLMSVSDDNWVTAFGQKDFVTP